MTAAISPLHELFHLEAKKQKIFTGKNLSEKLKIAVLGLEDIVDQKVELGSITEATANSIKNRLKQYKDDPSLTEETRLEEVMAVLVPRCATCIAPLIIKFLFDKAPSS